MGHQPRLQPPMALQLGQFRERFHFTVERVQVAALRTQQPVKCWHQPVVGVYVVEVRVVQRPGNQRS